MQREVKLRSGWTHAEATQWVAYGPMEVSAAILMPLRRHQHDPLIDDERMRGSRDKYRERMFSLFLIDSPNHIIHSLSKVFHVAVIQTCK